MPKPTASYTPKPKWPEGTRWAAVGNPISKVGGGRYLLIHDHLFVHIGDAARTLHDIAVIDIAEIDVVQSTLQKTRGLATIRVTVGHGDDSNQLTLDDVKEFREGVAAITGAIADARLAANGGLASTEPEPVAEQAPDAAAQARDFIAELGALAAYHRDGVLTDEEFAAAKRKLLAL